MTRFRVIKWDFKSPLHFYIGEGGGRRLVQTDFFTILEEVIASNWDKDWILLEDNDGAHSTRGVANNKVKQAKRRLDIN